MRRRPPGSPLFPYTTLFRSLETIREYGLETLAASGEMESTRKAHADYYVLLAEEAEPELAGAQQVVWLKRLERSEEHTSELQSHSDLVCRLLLEKKKKTKQN